MELAFFTILATSFVITLSGALMPGPLLTVTISESSRKGAMAGPVMIFGHALLELALIFFLLSGLAPFLAGDATFIVIALAGGAVLLFMGTTMVRELPGLTLTGKNPAPGSKNLVVTGIVLSVVNPYWLIWWASIGTGYIMQSLAFGMLGVCAFFLGHILADFGWYGFVSFGIAKGKKLLSDTVYRRIIGGCALCLILFSGWFFYSGITRLITVIST
ncbi:LysE family transporter [Desulforhopalus singaporensis]|uniref:Threonine/homoserine/homoserine lactone efflux protein n=1 Tax=Desulforhopalus singaporensis TaxID=91360 RepID=A0A1H0J6K5_9BACT|nr:LysE family transporter [Desulforhopalus singaporensis]SDO38981.1 Threonine/homoserine/homoserine lactone efflux protein [Desulforhopalus singaporensis]